MLLRRVLPAVLVSVFLLAGCGVSPSNPASGSQVQAAGRVMGGQQPVAGATIQLYAVGTGGDGSAATPLLTQAVTTGADGSFSLTGLYPCVPGTLVYLVATKGSPTLTSGGTPSGSNPNLALLAALGTCDSLKSSTYIVLNEVTTVAGVSALAPFMTSLAGIGSSGSDLSGLQADFAMAAEFADFSTGMSPGTGVPNGYSVPSAEIYTLANILATCVNSYGGSAGDGTACGTLFALTTPQGTTPPTDTIQAMLEIALHPTLNTPTLYMQPPPSSPFFPALTAQPPNFSVALTYTSSLQISPLGLGFPAEVVGGSASPNETVTLTNTSLNTIVIDSVGASGTNPSDFTLGSCPATLAAGASCSLTVSFSPGGYGARSANLGVLSSAVAGTVYVPLSGVGINSSGTLLFASPSSLTFYKGEAGVAETPQTLQLINGGSTAVLLGAMSFGGAGADFSETNTCPTELAAGGACTVTVGLTPSTSAAQTASLLVANSSATNPVSVALNENVVGTTGYITISPNDVGVTDFASGSFTIESSGSAPLILSSIQATGGFTQTNNCPASLASQAMCTVTFTPNYSLVGPFDGSIVISDNAPSSPQVVPISTSIDYLEPLYLFGSAIVGSTSTITYTYQVYQDGTTYAVLKGPDAADFSPSSFFCGGRYGESGYCPMTISFHPTALGPRVASFTFNGLVFPIPDVSLSGMGIAAGPAATFIQILTPKAPNPSNSVAPGGSATESGTIYNVGNTALDFTGSSVTFTGPNASAFTSGSMSCTTLAIGAQCSASFLFSPPSAGAYQASMNLYDRVSGSTIQIPVAVASVP